MLSLITIASSTTMPMAMMNANMVSMFNVWPANNSTAHAPNSETGMPVATHHAVRKLRNNAKAMNTSTIPCRPSSINRCMRSSTSIERSA